MIPNAWISKGVQDGTRVANLKQCFSPWAGSLRGMTKELRDSPNMLLL